nr:MAG TPA: hypothetical protein [Caudoviricetes sp.]
MPVCSTSISAINSSLFYLQYNNIISYLAYSFNRIYTDLYICKKVILKVTILLCFDII